MEIFTIDHNYWMSKAIEEAHKAIQKEEVPVGAVIVCKNKIVGVGHNLRHSTHRSIAHAEILAIEEANRNLDVWRLIDCTLYVTLEPCLMCIGAISMSRISQLVFGAFDLKRGAVKYLRLKELNHTPSVVSGILESECSDLLTNFFSELRLRNGKAPLELQKRSLKML